jgi:hypothetical protein
VAGSNFLGAVPASTSLAHEAAGRFKRLLRAFIRAYAPAAA